MATNGKSSDELLRKLQDIVEEGNREHNATNTTSTSTYTPTQYTPFSTLDSLNMQAKAWDGTDTDIASAYKSLANGLGSYSSMANTIGDFYNQAAKNIANRESAYANASFQLADQLNQDLANQRDYIWGVFGPEGSLTTEINRYYDDMGNYLASEGGRQMAKVAAQGLHSGASLGLLRAQENEAYNNAFANYLKVKEQEINAKQQIQAQLINYMTKLREEYGNTTNSYILAQYQRANDLLNKLDTDLASQYTTLGLYKIQGGNGKGSSSSNGTSGAGTRGGNGGAGDNGAGGNGNGGNNNGDDAITTENVAGAVTSNNNSYNPSWGRKALGYAGAALTVPFLGVPGAYGVYKYITK